MKYIIALMAAATLTGALLLAAAVFDFNSAERFDEVKITDVTISILVPVSRAGAVRPEVPEDLRELRKSETIAYSDEHPEFASHAIVVMIVPSDYVEEFMARVSKHKSVQVLSKEEVIEATEFAEGVDKLEEMENKVEYALTPAAVLQTK